jgi:hypothetical protein
MSIDDELEMCCRNDTRRKTFFSRLIMRALTNAMANDRRSTGSGAVTRPTEDEWMQLIRLFATIKTVYAKTAAPTSHCCCCLAEEQIFVPALLLATGTAAQVPINTANGHFAGRARR